jgi:NitT/TauT family transport system permease protein
MLINNRLNAFLYSSLVITLLWYAAFLTLKLPIVPSPIVVYKNVLQIFSSKIAIHVLYSLYRISSGLGVSILIGVPIGFLMGYYNKADKLLAPLLYFTYPIPKLALLPIIMLLFGLGERSKIIMIVLIIVFQIIITARDAVREIPKEAYHSLLSLGGSKLQVFREIIFPATLSEVITSIRLALGTAISILFFTETFGTEHGMGFLIMDSWMRVNYIEMYSAIVVLSILGLLIFTLIDIIERRICSWR